MIVNNFLKGFTNSDIHSPLTIYSSVFFDEVIFIDDNGLSSIKQGGHIIVLTNGLAVRAVV